MKVIWGDAAKRDLRELVAYISQESVQAAELVSHRILEAAELLGQMPRIGRPGRVKGTRERVIGRTRDPWFTKSLPVGSISFAFITALAAGRQDSTRSRQSRIALQSLHAAFV